ncbi:MAG: site-2 protease family protein [bacterium]|nr:site-2 protease family protein [bacterium]
MLLLIGFGWGKPVPFDASSIRYRRWGPTLIALAGPLMNCIGIVVAGTAIAMIDRTGALPANNMLVLFLAFLFQINAVLLLFNLIPIPPLDGSKVLLSILDSPRYDRIRFLLETRGPMFLLALVIVDGFLGGAILGRVFHAALRWTASLFA